MIDDDDRIHDRAALLPEELAAGSDDPEAQAAAVLADSDDREEYRETAPDLRIEHRTSDEAAS
ncbi:MULTISPECIES: hypothetical protein [Dactylosporangium]|uniref:Uncharacterized protein n=2 Tax=Dactylosporangium TaxID=35753 RepID=A0A9W6KJ07_9ACTN|nr:MULTISPECIES: hypothetical protein [Dactylosporangium]UAB98129.1 hypothetical protein Dvina_08565 [Dactylosporangium vinaceum]UWZ46374.1 hypothetical protein Dmats_08080 [Dactylosporangium matsuzakiense]GLL02088.1 hypothetical protein GCM10017581_038300 [Dactylosporangium matsuzakiense]